MFGMSIVNGRPGIVVAVLIAAAIRADRRHGEGPGLGSEQVDECLTSTSTEVTDSEDGLFIFVCQWLPSRCESV